MGSSVIVALLASVLMTSKVYGFTPAAPFSTSTTSSHRQQPQQRKQQLLSFLPSTINSHHPYHRSRTTFSVSSSPATKTNRFCQNKNHHHDHHEIVSNNNSSKSPSYRRTMSLIRRIMSQWLSQVLARFDTIQSAGLDAHQVQTAGIFRRVKDMHNPITYLVLAGLAGLKWRWCFRNPYFWFGVAFCIKWYRARYVFKIPVWDRQPNWNNVITSKEQEKDLKAFTCKKCGSTLFIAKTREFFFEGDTGIGGLGCFSCGAKGAENFVMDRDRIVEDVADEDDYFEYERPLDFVSRAERRKLLKEAEGDEEKANLLLLERTTGISSDTETEDKTESTVVDAEIIPSTDEDVVEGAVVDEDGSDDDASPTAEAVVEQVEEPEEAPAIPVVEEEPVAPPPPPPSPSNDAADDGEDLDALDMDAF